MTSQSDVAKATLLLLPLLLVAGCGEPTAPTARATAETTGIEMGEWTGSIFVLPTGERVLLTNRYHTTTQGGQISTAAVLLPPLVKP